ncbi:hypothetical protein RPMA_07735 [Tardiphaga alba]|uniref:Uncharacterized protein n=1 Tax=Tardiphaga alba TaxID=340268 RepID=A0ABX8AAB8_9BRAD|nr:hypothetical protein [Tardiphaga alba]QUS38735.1 hypothetical protein RPMA_07735 [Tardiphaga alba]
MFFTPDQLVEHPGFAACLQRQSAGLIGAFEGNPRLTAVFATQQRWLMAHAALALYFRSPERRIKLADFFDVVALHEIASRNTADTFVKEMVHYDFARATEDERDKRTRPIEPTAESLAQVHGWLMLHLATLDGLDGGSRYTRAMAHDDILVRVQPLVADGLLVSPAIRKPDKTFALFTWINSGGLVMDRIMAGISLDDIQNDRIPTASTSAIDMVVGLALSRGHLLRKLRAAEAIGSLGWAGKRGQSAMWISQGFWREYAMAQAEKLVIIERAYAAGAP